MQRILAAFSILALLTIPAAAQRCWPDPNDTGASCGVPVMYLNGSSQAVPVTSSAGLPVSVLTQGYTAAVSVTRPANVTDYTANDVVGATAAAISFPSMGPSGGNIAITSVELQINVTAVPAGMTTFRLYLYSVTPPSALADNAAFDLPAGDRASFLGYVDLGTPVDLGSTLYVRTDGMNAQFKLAGTGLFGYLVTAGGFTPGAVSEVYKVSLHAKAL